MRSYPMVPTAAKVVRGPRRTSRTLTANRQDGFTLIEVAAVMLIVALLASLVLTLTPGTGRAQLKALALHTAALMRRERLDAILTGRTHRVVLDGEKRIFVGDGGNWVPVPRDITLDVLGVDEQFAGNALVNASSPDSLVVFGIKSTAAEYS